MKAIDGISLRRAPRPAAERAAGNGSHAQRPHRRPCRTTALLAALGTLQLAVLITGCSESTRPPRDQTGAPDRAATATPAGAAPTGGGGGGAGGAGGGGAGGGGGGAGGGGGGGGTQPGPGWILTGEGWAYFFDSLIRIGDDPDYNASHDDDFVVSGATAPTYGGSFVLSSSPFTRAELRYEMAGGALPNRLILNNALAGTTCQTGDKANRKQACPHLDVTAQLRTGNNTLLVQTVLFSDGRGYPLDDIEIYGMHLQLLP